MITPILPPSTQKQSNPDNNPKCGTGNGRMVWKKKKLLYNTAQSQQFQYENSAVQFTISMMMMMPTPQTTQQPWRAEEEPERRRRVG